MPRHRPGTMKILHPMTKILPVLAALATAACASRQPETAELPPPCTAEAAARARADGTIVMAPTASHLLPPPTLAAGTDSVRIDLVVGVDGRVVHGRTRVTGTDAPRAVRQLTAWAEGVRFRPATTGGCAIESQTSLTIS
jgi:hypothetical protein